MKRAAIALLILLSVLAVSQYLNFTGFCYAEGRWLSDADLIRGAIEYTLRRAPPRGSDDIKYSSVDDFLERNRDCCRVLRHDREEFEGIADGHWVRVFGWYILTVKVWYQMKVVGPNNFADSTVVMTSCGEFSERYAFVTSRSEDAGRK